LLNILIQNFRILKRMADGCTLDTTDNDLSTLVKDDEPIHSTWGKLNSLDTATAPNVDLTTDSIAFGRSKELPAECQFNDKRISLKHCRIWREEQQDGLAKIWIEDSR
jgi:hypothetical protein